MGSGRDFLLGVVVGATIGAVAALLTAPKSGKELRKELQSGLELAKEQGTSILDVVKDHSSFTTSQAREVKERTPDKWIEIQNRNALPGGNHEERMLVVKNNQSISLESKQNKLETT